MITRAKLLALTCLIIVSPVESSTVAEESDGENAAPGLTLCFNSPGSDGSLSNDCRTSRLLALYVPENHAASIGQRAGRFRATFRGFIEIDLGDEFQFTFEGRGKIELAFAGKKVASLESEDFSKEDPIAVELDGGRIPLELHYESPASGDAHFRTFWASFDWLREPISPALLFHDAEDEQLRSGLELRRGRELFATLHCLDCHASSIDLATAMPELSMRGPSLVGVGDRLSRAWLARWIANPRAVRASATMPRLLASGKGEEIDGLDRRAWDIAAYLESLQESKTPSGGKKVESNLGGDAGKGGELFADLGCIGCHSLSALTKRAKEAEREDAAVHEDDRLSLDQVPGKWSTGALVEFLRDPDKRYEWTRMPDFRLDEKEATSLAAFVIANATPRSGDDPAHGDAASGKKLVDELGCGSCHEIEPTTEPKRSKPLAQIAKSKLDGACLSSGDESAKDGVPGFGLSTADLGALRAFLERGLPTLARRADTEFAARQIRSLRCGSCHARDSDAAVWTNFESEVAHLTKREKPESSDPLQSIPGVEFSVVQARPPLTWAGEKLRPEWTRKFLSGELGYDTRPWLKSRMPNFPIRAAGIASGLALEHGVSAKLPPQPEPNRKVVPIGKKLALEDGGFACVSCHAAGAYGGDKVFEVPGLNFQFTTERLRKDHFIRWMLNPGRVVPNSRMPQFADLEGRSQFTEHFEGDAIRQFDAIWQWLLEGRKISSPEKR